MRTQTKSSVETLLILKNRQAHKPRKRAKKLGPVASVLAKALEIVRHQWTKHAYRNHEQFCAIGAINYAAGGRGDGMIAGDGPDGQAADLLGEQLFGDTAILDAPARMHVPGWNDAPSTTRDQVVEAFEKTLAVAKERGL